MGNRYRRRLFRKSSLPDYQKEFSRYRDAKSAVARLRNEILMPQSSDLGVPGTSLDFYVDV